MNSQISPEVYRAAHETAVYVNRSNLGMLKITGETRLDLINRMSTQKLVALPSGAGAATVLTTDIGRIIDRLIIYTSSDSVYALTGEDNSDNIARYLIGYVFFNDDFHLQDMSAETAVFAVYGPQSQQILGAQVGFPEVDIPLHHWREAKIGGVAAYLHRTDAINGFGYFVICAAADSEAVEQQLKLADLTPADEDAFEFLRIEAGLPRFGHELTRDYIPLEANLWDDVSFNKGCYIGQEIIARMESRGRLAKRLVKLTAAASLPDVTELSAAGKKAGAITSSAIGPGGVAALGYVKTAVLEAGAPLMLDDVPVMLAEYW